MVRQRMAASVLVLAALLVAAGCNFGEKARDNALLPVLRSSAAGVEEDAAAGVDALPAAEQAAASVQVEAFFSALRSDPVPSDALVLWSPVRALCLSGIEFRVDAGLIGPNVAASLRERVDRFEEGLEKYLAGKG